MRRIRLEVSYDGTEFHGWQVQKETDKTIEGQILRAIKALLSIDNPVLIGASRTDAGVHALGNVAVFDTDSPIPAERFPMALNRYLPESIRVLKAKEENPDFYPRAGVKRKVYLYRIDRSRIPSPLKARYCYSYSYPLNIEEMREAAKMLLGRHDFRSFANPESQVLMKGGSPVRTIDEISVSEVKVIDGEEILIRVAGDGFLYHMVRIIVGTLLEVGRGRWESSEIERILLSRDRRKAGPTVPAKGLCLVKISYLSDM